MLLCKLLDHTEAPFLLKGLIKLGRCCCCDVATTCMYKITLHTIWSASRYHNYHTPLAALSGPDGRTVPAPTSKHHKQAVNRCLGTLCMGFKASVSQLAYAARQYPCDCDCCRWGLALFGHWRHCHCYCLQATLTCWQSAQKPPLQHKHRQLSGCMKQI